MRRLLALTLTLGLALPLGSAKAQVASCRVSDQVEFVYHPDRLLVLRQCIRVTGVVVGFFPSGDGDVHILVRLDPPFVRLLRPGNVNPDWPACAAGCLIVEPVCVNAIEPDDAAAVAACAADHDPVRSLPEVGDRVQLEGRYVLDVPHGGWAEIHPLSRWWLDRLGSDR